MGSMTFLLPERLSPAADAALRRACLAGGYDQNPVPTRVHVLDHKLVVSRELNESGYLLLPWPVEPYGGIVTTTTTLRERPEPYSLLVELARGKLNQVRCQTSEWRSLGLRTTPDFDRDLRDASALFGRSALGPPTAESDAHAARVLEASYGLADRLVRGYTAQVFDRRRQDGGGLATRFGTRLVRPLAGPEAGDYGRVFNAAQIAFRWTDLEPSESQYDWSAVEKTLAAAEAAGLQVSGGPVIDLAPGMLPAWAAGWAGDLPTLAAFMCDFLETVLNRYRGRVRRWQVCAGFNQEDAYGLSDDERLRLAARLFDAAAQIDPGLDLVLGVAQPWGDYLGHEDQTIPPLQFADDLIRSGLRVAAVELEMRAGTSPRGGMRRDLIEACRVIDLFGLLGLPVEVLLGCPSADRPDPAAEGHGQCVTPFAWTTGPSPETQADWGAAFAALALCKPHVRAVTWDHWSDADPHLVPHGGLIGLDNFSKPLLARLALIRSAHFA